MTHHFKQTVAGIEFSFYFALTFDGSDLGYACGSVLFDADAGLALNLGFGFGICFTGSSSLYIEFTIGGGIGVGVGFNVCGVLTLAGDEFGNATSIEPTAAPLLI